MAVTFRVEAAAGGGISLVEWEEEPAGSGNEKDRGVDEFWVLPWDRTAALRFVVRFWFISGHDGAFRSGRSSR
jgi:hypothetical protein